MRDRHLPRICRSCDAPMAGQDDACWKCGASWDYRLSARNPVSVIRGDAAEPSDGDQQQPAPAAVAVEAA
jgi:hypothetical protein